MEFIAQETICATIKNSVMNMNITAKEQEAIMLFKGLRAESQDEIIITSAVLIS